MDSNSFVFKIPPPPPPTSYLKRPPPPPLPKTPPIIQQPPPPPPPPPSPTPSPPTTTTNWMNWNVDFSRPPPVFNNTQTSTELSQLGHEYRMGQTMAAMSQNRSNQNSIQIHEVLTFSSNNNRQTVNRRYRPENFTTNQQGWAQRSNFKKQRYDGIMQQRNDVTISEPCYMYNVDTRYNRNSNSDTRYSTYPRISNTGVLSNNNEESTYRSKKRKKPLSQAVPAKKAWTEEEAQMAIDIEKEYNKLLKNHSLKIKFPDQELNREIVSKFHSSIETVYFQQPSNPRFCFVTLADGADPNSVIEQLNKIKFGLGYLSAEYKKDREEEQNVGPDDVDPLTLYVGNLAQSVTKVDMLKFYPTSKRIDIGFAKKMKYTRYAFVSFKNVHDSIEAFKATHSANLHSKSMIVRFRRLHGTVGMPGEPKIQNPSKENQEDSDKRDNVPVSTSQSVDTSASLYGVENHDPDVCILESNDGATSSYGGSHSRTISESSDSSNFDLSLVKSEPYSYYDDSSDDTRSDDGVSVLESVSSNNRGVVLQSIVKKEPDFDTSGASETSSAEYPVRPFALKTEPPNETILSPEQLSEDIVMQDVPVLKTEVKNERSDPVDPEDNEEEFNTSTDFGSILTKLQDRNSFLPH